MRERRIALFPGSFDPFTNGHLNTVERSSKLFDEVVIGIFTNTTKKPLFSPVEKKRLTEISVEHLKNVSVITQSDGLTIDIAKNIGAKFLVRGVRNSQDYEYEKNIAFMNKQMDSEIETIFLLADESYSNISSSMIKEIAKFSGNVSSFVPREVNMALKKKYEQGE